jgi:hypothetical protein
VAGPKPNQSTNVLGSPTPAQLGIKIIDGNQADAMNIFAIATAVGIFVIAVVVLLGLWLLLRE